MMRSVKILCAVLAIVLSGCYQSMSGSSDVGNDPHEVIHDPIIYASMCSTGAGCTYRPGEWTWNVILDPGARDFVTLFEDGVGHLYLFFRDDSANAIYWRFKRSE